jgi:hypothetical protein
MNRFMRPILAQVWVCPCSLWIPKSLLRFAYSIKSDETLAENNFFLMGWKIKVSFQPSE